MVKNIAGIQVIDSEEKQEEVIMEHGENNHHNLLFGMSIFTP